jgi:hypothetical protein
MELQARPFAEDYALYLRQREQEPEGEVAEIEAQTLRASSGREPRAPVGSCECTCPCGCACTCPCGCSP